MSSTVVAKNSPPASRFGIRMDSANSAGMSLASLDRLGTVISVKRDATVFSEGDRSHYFFRVVTGAMRSCCLLADGRRHINDFFLPGDFIGLDADDHYRFTAEAVADATLVRYPRSAIEQFTSIEPGFGKHLLDLLSRQLIAAQQHMLLLGRKTATERVASFLVTMGGRTRDAGNMSLPMTRSDIADHLGLTTETVSRAFTQLKTQGVIGLEGAAHVIVQDGAALEELAEAC